MSCPEGRRRRTGWSGLGRLRAISEGVRRFGRRRRSSTCWPPPKPTVEERGPARSWPNASRTERSPSPLRANCRFPRKRVNEDLAGYAGHRLPLDLRALVRSTVRSRSRSRLFQVMEIGGAPHRGPPVSGERPRATAYRMAARRIEGGGRRPLRAWLGPGRHCPGLGQHRFLRRAGADRPARVRSIDRSGAGSGSSAVSNPLLDDLRRILSVAPRIALSPDCTERLLPRAPRRLRHALGDPSARICAEIPGARVSGSELIFDGRLDRSVSPQPE